MPHPKRQTPATAEHAVSPRRGLAARIPWIPVVLTLLVILSAGAAMRPVRDAATLAEVSEAYLTKPLGYVLLAPLSATFDTIVLMSVRQHVAMLGGLLLTTSVVYGKLSPRLLRPAMPLRQAA